ncbi:MAG TPA: hypothetical protein VIL95_03060 [Bacillota bacterium]
MTWYHAVVSVHVLSAVLWVGGILFLSVVAVPVLRRLEPGTRARRLRAAPVPSVTCPTPYWRASAP